MNANGLVSVIASIVVLAMITTLVLPNRQTGNVLTAGFNGLAASIRAAMGN